MGASLIQMVIFQPEWKARLGEAMNFPMLKYCVWYSLHFPTRSTSIPTTSRLAKMEEPLVPRQAESAEWQHPWLHGSSSGLDRGLDISTSPKVERIFQKWHFYLVGGLEHVFFLHSVGTFIIPTDDEVIFFRGVGIPPTSYGLWYIICSGKNAGTRERAWDFVMAGMHPCIAFVLNEMFTPNVQRGWRLVQWGQLIYLSFVSRFLLPILSIPSLNLTNQKPRKQWRQVTQWLDALDSCTAKPAGALFNLFLI